MSVSADEEATAYHEAGHAVMGAIRNRPPEKVTIISQGRVAGRTDFPDDCPEEYKSVFNNSPEKRLYVETRILITMAGSIAHDIRFPKRTYDPGDKFDEQIACDLIDESTSWADDCHDGYCRRLRETARELLQTNSTWVDAVAQALIESKTISGGDVMRLRPAKEAG